MMKNWPTFNVFGAHKLPGLQSEISLLFFFMIINPSQLMMSIHRPDKKALWTVVLPGSCYAWPLSVSVLYITNPESKMYFLR